MSTEHGKKESIRIALSIADELRSNPELWTQGYLARDRNGKGCDSEHPQAVCWCIYGHILKRLPSISSVNVFAVSAVFAEEIPAAEMNATTDVLSDWNDRPGRTVRDVINLCDRVAARQ